MSSVVELPKRLAIKTKVHIVCSADILLFSEPIALGVYNFEVNSVRVSPTYTCTRRAMVGQKMSER